MCQTPLRIRKVKENIEMGDKNSNAKGVSPQLVPQQITTLAGVCDILFGMRRCRINLPNRCQRLIGRVAHRAFEGGKRRIERVAPL